MGDRFNNVVRGDIVNRGDAEDVFDDDIDTTITTAVDNGLEEVEEGVKNIASTENIPQSSGTDSETGRLKRIFVNILLPSSEITVDEINVLKENIETQLEFKTGIKVESLVNVTETELVTIIGDITNYYYIPVTVDRFSKVVRGDPINKLSNGSFNEAEIEVTILTSVETGLEEIESSTQPSGN